MITGKGRVFAQAMVGWSVVLVSAASAWANPCAFVDLSRNSSQEHGPVYLVVGAGGSGKFSNTALQIEDPEDRIDYRFDYSDAQFRGVGKGYDIYEFVVVTRREVRRATVHHFPGAEGEGRVTLRKFEIFNPDGTVSHRWFSDGECQVRLDGSRLPSGGAIEF